MELYSLPIFRSTSPFFAHQHSDSPRITICICSGAATNMKRAFMSSSSSSASNKRPNFPVNGVLPRRLLDGTLPLACLQYELMPLLEDEDVIHLGCCSNDLFLLTQDSIMKRELLLEKMQEIFGPVRLRRPLRIGVPSNVFYQFACTNKEFAHTVENLPNSITALRLSCRATDEYDDDAPLNVFPKTWPSKLRVLKLQGQWPNLKVPTLPPDITTLELNLNTHNGIHTLCTPLPSNLQVLRLSTSTTYNIPKMILFKLTDLPSSLTELDVGIWRSDDDGVLPVLPQGLLVFRAIKYIGPMETILERIPSSVTSLDVGTYFNTVKHPMMDMALLPFSLRAIKLPCIHGPLLHCVESLTQLQEMHVKEWSLPLNELQVPTSLRTLRLSNIFGSAPINYTWPSHLTRLNLEYVHDSFHKVQWPPMLRVLHLQGSTGLAHHPFPVSLTALNFDSSYVSVDNLVLPPFLRWLKIGIYFNKSLPRLPATLEVLHIAISNQPDSCRLSLKDVQWPVSLRHLFLPDNSSSLPNCFLPPWMCLPQQLQLVYWRLQKDRDVEAALVAFLAKELPNCRRAKHEECRNSLEQMLRITNDHSLLDLD